MNLQSFFKPNTRMKKSDDAPRSVSHIHIGNQWKKFFTDSLKSFVTLGVKISADTEPPRKDQKRESLERKNGVQKTTTGRITTRIAPSPTGLFHIGTARSALFNYLFARQNNGVFIVRIEDTDAERSKKEYEVDIIQSLAWLGLEHDQFYRQSERGDVYKKYLDQLIKSNKAYLSKEPRKDTPLEMTEVVRLRNPNTDIVFEDLVRGTITFNTTELGDFAITRNATDPLYHFAVVVDDYDMGITHIIRGEDHISNTPRQILIQQALGFPRPQYAHIPLILNPDRTKMSKRGVGSTVEEYQREGYHPEAVLNYLALLGWNPGTDQETFTLPELIETFDIKKIQRSPAIFNKDKMLWFNQQFFRTIPKGKIARTTLKELPPRLRDTPESAHKVERMIPLLQEKAKTTADITRLISNGELDYFFIRPSIDTGQLSFKGEESKEDVARHLKAVVQFVEFIPASGFTKEAVKRAVWDYAEKEGRGAVLWPMRFVLSGKEKSPDPFVIAEILGKKETLERLSEIIETV